MYGGGSWFYPSVVDWMEADLNVSLQSIVRKVLGLSRLNERRLKITSYKKNETYMDESFIIRSITPI